MPLSKTRPKLSDVKKTIIYKIYSISNRLITIF